MMRYLKELLSFTVILLIFPLISGQDDVGVYKIGTGISDITGPAAGVVLVNKYF